MPLVTPKTDLEMPHIPLKTFLGALLLFPIIVPVLQIVIAALRTRLSASHVVPGPSGGNFLLGYLRTIRKSIKGEWHEEMVKKYGHVIRYKTFLGEQQLFIKDPKALNRMLTHADIYRRSSASRYGLSKIAGEGLLHAEGTGHKRQRRVLNPAFSSGHLKELTEIFLSKSQELRDILLGQMKAPSTPGVSPSAKVDMLAYLTQATLDIIGLAGFGYNFDALYDRQTDMSEAIDAVLHSPGGIPVIQLLKMQIPLFRYIFLFDKGTRDRQRAKDKMDAIGRDLIRKKKAELLEEKAAGSDAVTKSKDLLSLLMKSNLDERGNGLTDDEVLGQIPTFIIAGHETTATSTTWALFSLGAHPDMQRRLRSELLLVPTDTPTMGELDSLVYLDAFVREALRYHSVVNGLIKEAVKDDILPLEKPFMGRDGKMRDFLEVSRGDTFFIPILAMNTEESIWGHDANEFNPDRWINEKTSKMSQSLPSVWGNQMTFSAGPRACIGFKFSVIEMKALLFTLVRSFELELAVPVEEIIRKTPAVTRPEVRSEPEKRGQLPMIIRPVNYAA